MDLITNLNRKFKLRCTDPSLNSKRVFDTRKLWQRTTRRFREVIDNDLIWTAPIAALDCKQVSSR
jgi:hypothetical protein